jgi:L-lactate dehydrogenase complex protein LldF
LLGVEAAADLPFASSLCGACAEYCPVKIPIPEILIHLRRRVVEGDAVDGPAVSPALRLAAHAASLGLSAPKLYELGTQLARLAQAPLVRDGWLPNLPPPVNRWTVARPFPAFRGWFRQYWRTRTPEKRAAVRRRQLRTAGVLLAAAALLLAVGSRVRRNGGHS